jgi:hypothetical protein
MGYGSTLFNVQSPTVEGQHAVAGQTQLLHYVAPQVVYLKGKL